MNDTAESRRYTTVAIVLHWLIAAVILTLIFAGWYMSDLPDGAPTQQFLYQLHKSFGICVLLLTLARIAWRMMNRPPPLPADMDKREKLASHAIHMAFYALMIIMPLTGWLYASTAYEFQVPTVLFGIISWPHLPFVDGLKNEAGHGAVEFLHSKAAWIMLGLLALHVIGAIKHELSAEEGVLKRMVPGLFGKAGAPVAGRGAIFAVGAPVALFLLVASGPILGGVLSPGGGIDKTQSGASWAIDYAASEIRFSGVHDGDDFSGTFSDWAAQIEFDANALSVSKVDVQVDLASARTGTKLYDDSLAAAEWFNIGDFPVAAITLSNMREVAAGAYEADMSLSLKGNNHSAVFEFELNPDEVPAVMSGQVVLRRDALDLGQQSDPGADWVDNDVQVDVKVVATRAN